MHRLNLVPTQFGNVGFEPDLAKQAGYLGSQPPGGKRFFYDSAAQNIPYFLFHAASVPPRATLQSHLDRILDIADDELSHEFPQLSE